MIIIDGKKFAKMSNAYPNGADITVLNVIYIKPETAEQVMLDQGSGDVLQGDIPTIEIDKDAVRRRYDNYEVEIYKKDKTQTRGYDPTTFATRTRDQYPKKIDDYIFMSFVDNKTGETHHAYIPKPEYTYYHKIKDVKNYPEFFTEKSNVEPITCRYKDLKKSIVKTIGKEQEYKDLKANGAYKEANDLCIKDPSIFFADMRVVDWYRYRFSLSYPNEPMLPIRKGFFDIECDNLHEKGSFPELGECPVNAVSFYDEYANTIHTVLLRNPNNPLIEEFEKSISPKLYSQLYNFIIGAVGGPERAEKLGVTGVKQKFYFFDDELELLKGLFLIFNTKKPHFMMGWNMGTFDMPYLIERIKVLGADPRMIMCDPTVPLELKTVDHYIDEDNKSKLNKRSDYTDITGDSVWLDQMILFATVRSSSYGSFKSFKLDDIGALTAGVHKLDYHHITNKLAELPYLDYKTFVFYNIMDVVCQKCIEAVGKDIDFVLAKALVNNTSYAKVHRQTVYLVNKISKEFDNMGYVIGNNTNKNNPKPDKYAGAIVTEPKLTNSYPKRKINGEPAMIADNTIDEDYKALYPSTEMENNIAPNTQIGKIEMKEKIYDKENVLNEEKYERSGEFIENYNCDNKLEFAHRYLKLATVKEFLLIDLPEFIGHKIKQFAMKPRIPFTRYRANAKINPFIKHEKADVSPFISYDNNGKPEKEYSEYIKDLKETL